MTDRQVLSVRALTLYIKQLLDRDQMLAAVWVRGEISNFKHHTSGHMYFTLKDEHSQIRCVMFRSSAERLRFRPEHGLRVLAGGHVTVYERDGAYQLYVREMTPDGQGSLHLAFEQIKARLAAEGLFDAAKKRPLPRLPRVVGLVTSPTGAAVRDMITVARRRNPRVRMVLAPAAVQGEEAVPALVLALRRVVRVPGVDVVIIGRGGGSLEDLWAFNEEAVARAIAACPVPVISAVGHETDFTIADFVADARAPTPSAAAELAVPLYSELQASIEAASQRLGLALRGRVARARERLTALAGRPALTRPLDRIRQRQQLLDELSRRLGTAAGARVERGRHRLAAQAAALQALSPLAVLGRGYAIARDGQGQVLRAADSVRPGDAVEVILQRGRLLTTVDGTDPRPWPEQVGGDRGAKASP